MRKSTSEGLPSSKVKIRNRENTLSLTGRLDQVESAVIFGREHLDTAILSTRNILMIQKDWIPLVVYAMPSIVLIQSLELRVLGKKEGVVN